MKIKELLPLKVYPFTLRCMGTPSCLSAIYITGKIGNLCLLVYFMDNKAKAIPKWGLFLQKIKFSSKP